MDTKDVRRFLHDINNAVNSAKINVYLLRRFGGEIDKETLDGLDAAIESAEKLSTNFQRQIYSTWDNPSAPGGPRPGQGAA